MQASHEGVRPRRHTKVNQLPSRRVAALYLPKHRLARSDKGLGCKQSGRAWSLLSSWDRAAEVRRRRIHSLPPCPSCLRAPALAVTAIHRRPLRLGRQVTQRLCSTASAHVHGTTRARRCAKGRPPLPASYPPTNPNPSPHPHPNPSPSPSPSPGPDTGQAAPQPLRARHRSNPLRGSRNACLAESSTPPLAWCTALTGSAWCSSTRECLRRCVARRCN